jgi:hypothetical protein
MHRRHSLLMTSTRALAVSFDGPAQLMATCSRCSSRLVDPFALDGSGGIDTLSTTAAGSKQGHQQVPTTLCGVHLVCDMNGRRKIRGYPVVHRRERAENENDPVRPRMSSASMTHQDVSNQKRPSKRPERQAEPSSRVEYRRVPSRSVEWVREY